MINISVIHEECQHIINYCEKLENELKTAKEENYLLTNIIKKKK